MCLIKLFKSVGEPEMSWNEQEFTSWAVWITDYRGQRKEWNTVTTMIYKQEWKTLLCSEGNQGNIMNKEEGTSDYMPYFFPS